MVDGDSPFRRPPGAGPGVVLAGVCLAVSVVPSLFIPALYDDFTAPKQAALLVSAAIVLVGLALEGFPLPSSRWLRIALGAWSGVLVLSWAAGLDPLGTLAGQYQYRQGVLSELCYLVLFAGALRLAPLGVERAVAGAGMVGLAAAMGYAGLQTAGLDPVRWWTDTSDRAIGTVGNANELAAYAMIGVAFAGLGRWRGRTAVVAGTAAIIAALVTVVMSESRSGLLSFAAVAMVFPLAALVAGASRRTARRLALLAGGMAAVGVLLVASSGPGGALGRLDGAKDAGEGDTSTRLSLWRGTVATIAARPLLGFGPGALPLAFPRYRPADLEGEFERIDLVAQSSHNWPLDVAAGTGLAGLGALAALLAVVATASLRATRRDADGHAAVALSWTAVGGYGLMTLLNPISLSAHTVFWIVAGLLGGRAWPQRAALLPRAGALTIAVPTGIAAACTASLLIAADLQANEAWDNFAVGRFEDAAADYRGAAALAPWERQYESAQTEAWAWQYLIQPQSDALERLLAATDRVDRRFGLTWDDAMDRAMALAVLGRPTNETDRAIEQAVSLNPHGLFMASDALAIREAARVGGSLGFDERQRRIVLVPDVPGER